ncbi:hypothetical protein [Marinisporobacter balticus]|uniref:Uncharacterized protein n=1 Tax=Marinisporobacter balticus TaxID=2018667 RepID=A0A4R2KYM0_9FIRM|nr:hypothetical protein [Marinisporobacter balticus]TCO76446.1 hypothetical protein EV214_10848 [Marinisporobacter balticus]
MEKIKKIVSRKRIEKAYYLEEYPSMDTKSQEDRAISEEKNQLSDEFYKTMGKILMFVEKADEPL